MKKLNKKGFTIVELVIVIAVIAILAAVLIPTFSGVVEKANKSAALQEARNAYTNYVVAHSEDASFDNNVVIVSGDYYFKVTNGELDSNPNAKGDSVTYNDKSYTFDELDPSKFADTRYALVEDDDVENVYNYTTVVGTKTFTIAVAADTNDAQQHGTRSVAINGNTITITHTGLNEYASADSNQGTHKWVGVVLNFDFEVANKLIYNNGTDPASTMTATDVSEAEGVGGTAGKSIVVWVKCDEDAPKTFTLSADGYVSREITITWTKAN